VAIEWLSEQLDNIQGTMIPARNSHHMDMLLVERLKEFQRTQQLQPDGIAGPVTLIRINERIGLVSPKLNDQEQT